MRIYALTATFFIATAALPQSRGIPPRPNRMSYPIACFTDYVAVAAALMPPEKVRISFGPDVEKRYLVVEVGVFPKAGKVDIRHTDFSLRLVSPQTLSKPVPLTSLSENGAAKFVEKLLPETGTLKPVGGYLFFAVPDPPLYTAYELDYTGHGAWLTLPLTPKRR